MKNITVVGSGYVGMSIAVLFAKTNNVTVLDIDEKRVESINNKQSTIADKDIESYMSTKKLFLKATKEIREAYNLSNYIFIATPTNFDPMSNSFDTSSVDTVIEDIFKVNKDALIIIKSTIPIGYTDSLNKKYNTDRIIFCPEFLREGSALRDSLYPSRIIIGSKTNESKEVANLLQSVSKKHDVKVLFTSSNEAEAIKLFSNTYLAMRVAFFNELDSYAIQNNLNTKKIIDGISFDERIGEGYNNPSFGYGGYCLPKDTKHLLSEFKSTPESLITAIIDSNFKRKKFIANKILENKPNIIGIYRLIMKEGSDNFRSSAIQEIIQMIKKEDVKLIIYEPLMTNKNFNEMEVTSDFNYFISTSDIIVANRLSDQLIDHKDKVFSRDIFKEN